MKIYVVDLCNATRDQLEFFHDKSHALDSAMDFVKGRIQAEPEVTEEDRLRVFKLIEERQYTKACDLYNDLLRPILGYDHDCVYVYEQEVSSAPITIKVSCQHEGKVIIPGE